MDTQSLLNSTRFIFPRIHIGSADRLHERAGRLAGWIIMLAAMAPSQAASDRLIVGSAPIVPTSTFIHSNVGPTLSAWIEPLTDRHLSVREKSAPLEPDLVDAILRVEGVYDPTRIGLFGRSMQMEVRAGTASMSNVFGDRWIVADPEPNVHLKVRYLAFAWHRRRDLRCEDLKRFRPDDSLIVLDILSPNDCRRFLAIQGAPHQTIVASLAPWPISLPIFMSPYPGGRLSATELRTYQLVRIRALKERALLMRKEGFTR